MLPCTLISWNVNSYQLITHQWLSSYISKHHPDIIFLSETKNNYNALEVYIKEFTDYNYIINCHQPAKWHGVALLIKKTIDYTLLTIDLGIRARKDCNATDPSVGRIIAINVNNVNIICTYTPNSGGVRDQDKLDYRTKVWDQAFIKLLTSMEPTIWMGDINVAPQVIDVSHPNTMVQYAGFTLRERSNFRQLLDTGKYVDIWREQHPTEIGYTWLGKSGSGMRLDNIVLSKTLVDNVVDTFIVTDDKVCSDHLPIGMIIKL